MQKISRVVGFYIVVVWLYIYGPDGRAGRTQNGWLRVSYVADVCTTPIRTGMPSFLVLQLATSITSHRSHLLVEGRLAVLAGKKHVYLLQFLAIVAFAALFKAIMCEMHPI